MTIEPIGLLALIAGALMLARGPGLGIHLLLVAAILGSAAAIKLPAVGNASIPPSHVLLLFYVLAVLNLRGGLASVLGVLRFPSPGFWLLLFVAYGVVTAIFLPRVFAGQTDVYGIARSGIGRLGIVSNPLSPSAANITQSVYLLGNFALFSAVCAHIVMLGARAVTGALLLTAAVNIIFALLDIVTYGLGVIEVMDVIRNANYAILADASIAGLKRIVGSFPEASAFGTATMFLFVFSMELWLRGTWTPTTGSLAAASLALIVLSTSTSTYFGLAAYLALLYARMLVALLRGAATLRVAVSAIGAPLAAVVAVGALLLVPGLSQSLGDLIETTVIAKLSSHSGIERGNWNAQGLRVFLETDMLGAGVGSVRTSSFVVALLANTGLFGLLTFMIFLAAMLGRTARYEREPGGTVRAAAAWAAVSTLPAASVALSSVDLGLLFFCCAALAAVRKGRLPLATAASDHHVKTFEQRGAYPLAP